MDVSDRNVTAVLVGLGSDREFTQRLSRGRRPNNDDGRATLNDLVTEETAEQRVAAWRRLRC